MSQQTISEYRRLGRPAFFFLPLHNLEVRNAILHRAFSNDIQNPNRNGNEPFAIGTPRSDGSRLIHGGRRSLKSM
jgi:hypothetical protein